MFYSTNTRTSKACKQLLADLALVYCADSLTKTLHSLELCAYDLLLIDDAGQDIDFSQLRSQFHGLIALLSPIQSLASWAMQCKSSNSLLLAKPLHLVVLRQLCEQQLAIRELCDKEAEDPLLNQLQLSNLERRCLSSVLAVGKVSKQRLQRQLFADSGCLYDARLDACWSRLGKKLARQAPQLQLRRTYNGFLEIATCAP